MNTATKTAFLNTSGKKKQSEKLQKEINAFLKNGGKIEVKESSYKPRPESKHPVQKKRKRTYREVKSVRATPTFKTLGLTREQIAQVKKDWVEKIYVFLAENGGGTLIDIRTAIGLDKNKVQYYTETLMKNGRIYRVKDEALSNYFFYKVTVCAES